MYASERQVRSDALRLIRAWKRILRIRDWKGTLRFVDYYPVFQGHESLAINDAIYSKKEYHIVVAKEAVTSHKRLAILVCHEMLHCVDGHTRTSHQLIYRLEDKLYRLAFYE